MTSDPVPNEAPKESYWLPAVQGYFHLLVAVLLGSLVSMPVVLSRAPFSTRVTYLVRGMPDGDEALVEWGRSQAGTESFTVDRREGELDIRWESRGLREQPSSLQVIAQMRALGYEFYGMSGMSRGVTASLANLLRDPVVLASMLAGTQLAFVLVGLYQIRRRARLGRPLPPLFPGNPLRPFAWGVAGGCGLLAIGAIYTHSLAAILGRAAPSPWDAAGQMPALTKMAFLVFGALGAPVAEELFFRGYLFARIRQAGAPVAGLLFSALLFAGVHFSDPYHLPGTFLYGLVLGWLLVRTNSLLAPIVAHAVNNGIAIGLMFLGL